jgi:hypothetical protein
MSTTTALNKASVINDIVKYVQKCGGAYSQWYCGVAAVPADRLFKDHSVDRSGAWIYSPCASSDEARAIEDYFFRLGMKGGPGGGDFTTKTVYAYKITSSTRE